MDNISGTIFRDRVTCLADHHYYLLSLLKTQHVTDSYSITYFISSYFCSVSFFLEQKDMLTMRFLLVDAKKYIHFKQM